MYVSSCVRAPSCVCVFFHEFLTSIRKTVLCARVKGRGGGDGRVVFARVFSGALEQKKSLSRINADTLGIGGKRKAERPSALLGLSGGKMDILKGGKAMSGEVCAIVGLKEVVTGDTLVLNSDGIDSICLGGVTAPKPVLTVRLDPQSSEDERKMEEAFAILCVEDPSLSVQGTDGEDGAEDGMGSGILLSGLGELHIEVTVDRLKREFGINCTAGEPNVALKETLDEEAKVGEGNMMKFERDHGDKRMKAEVAIELEFNKKGNENEGYIALVDNVVDFGPRAKRFLKIDEEEEDSVEEEKEGEEVEADTALNTCTMGIISGIKEALEVGPMAGAPMTNVKCTVIDLKTDAGSADQDAGTLQAAANYVVEKLLKQAKDDGLLLTLEPHMRMTVNVNSEEIGTVVSDFTSRGGIVSDVSNTGVGKQTMVGKIPLKKILGYSTKLRSLTAGSGVFSAEYFAHNKV